MRRGRVDLGDLARRAAEDLRRSQPERQVTINIAEEIFARGDARCRRDGDL